MRMETGGAIIARSEGETPSQSLKDAIERFLGFIADEDFEGGRNWARKLVTGKAGAGHQIRGETLYRSLDRGENEFDYELPDQLPALPEDLAFLMYAGNYFSARYKIEQSYRYRHAHKLINQALRFLAVAERSTGSNLLRVLGSFSRLQNHLNEIEWACYNSDDTAYDGNASLMKAAAEKLRDAVDAIRGEEAGLTDYERGLYDHYLEPRLDAHALYASAILQVAALNETRWIDRGRFLADAGPALEDLHAKRARLGELGSSILENDLAPQIETLKAFTALPLTAEQNGELAVKNGKIEIFYYALLLPDVVDKVEAIVRRQVLNPEKGGISFPQLKGMHVEDDPLSDIWAWDGGANEELINSVSWRLPDLKIEFRNRTIDCAATLRFYNFGIFALSLKADVEDSPVSEIRHIASLGSPIALDEEIVWTEIGKTFGTLEDLAKFVFPIVETEVAQALSRSGRRAGNRSARSGALLSYSAIMNRFTALRVDQLALRTRAGSRALSPTDAVQHPAFKALTLPILEARCATDDWIMRRPPCPTANLAPLRYYQEGDVIHVCRHDGVLALLNQANWARDQAWEGMAVCAAITNFFCMASSMFSGRVRELVIEGREGRGKSGLRRTEADLTSIRKFEHEVREMLDRMEAGRVMRFPDLTLLVNKMFEHLGLGDLTSETRLVLSQARKMLSETQEALKVKSAEKLNFIAGFVGTLVALAQIEPLVNVVRDDLGVPISGMGHVAIYICLIALVSGLLIIGRYRRAG